jgi:signal transduction histidine kinase
MILLISPYQNAPDCATHIQRATHDTVQTVDSLRLALSALRAKDFIAVVADENLLEVSPGSADSLTQRMGTAIPVFLDMACLKPERIAKLVTVAIRRRELEFNLAREQAIAELSSELKNDLTGLLLSSRMALDSASHSPIAAQQLASVLEIAQRLKQRFDITE